MKRSTRSCTCGDSLKAAKPPSDAERRRRPTTQNQCRPAMKNSDAQTIDTSIVWPKSGSMISGDDRHAAG